MAKIRRIKKSPDLLFGEMTIQELGRSVPSISAAMYEEVVELAVAKYNRSLRHLTPELMRENVARSRDITFVDKGTLGVDVMVTQVEGRKVTFWLCLDLEALAPGALDPFLLSLLELLPADSGLRVEQSTFVGEVLLTEDPHQIPTQHNGVMSFLKSEGRAVISFLEQDLADSR